MKKSIGKKVMGVLLFLEIVLILVCLLNMSALKYIRGYSNDIRTGITSLEEAGAAGDEAAIQSVQADVEQTLNHIVLRINGTYRFNIALIVIIFVLMGIVFTITNRTIVLPAKNADKQLHYGTRRIELTGLGLRVISKFLQQDFVGIAH